MTGVALIVSEGEWVAMCVQFRCDPLVGLWGQRFLLTVWVRGGGNIFISTCAFSSMAPVTVTVVTPESKVAPLTKFFINPFSSDMHISSTIHYNAGHSYKVNTH